MFSLSVFVFWRSSGGSVSPLFTCRSVCVLSFDSVEVCCMLLCCCVLLSEPVGFGVCFPMSCCGVSLLSFPVGCGGRLLSVYCSVFVLLPVGVDVDVVMIVFISSFSGSTGVFLGEVVIRLIILLIFASLFVGLLSLLLGGAYMNALGLSEVKICSGLPWDKSEARLITSTDLSLYSRFVSSWMRGEFNLSFCRVVALPFQVLIGRGLRPLSVGRSLCWVCARVWLGSSLFVLVAWSFWLGESLVLRRVRPLGRVGPFGLMVLGCTRFVDLWGESSCLSSFLLTKTLLFFLDFFCFLVRFYMLQSVSV